MFINKENYIKLVDEVEESLKDDNGSSSDSNSMSLKPEIKKPKKSLSLDM